MDGELVVGPVTEVALDELVEPYDAVGWSVYTRTPALLRAAIAGSSYVVAARRARRLVGLARAVSDDATVCYLQDVLVVPEERRNGVGRALVAAVLARYPAVRQKVLLLRAARRHRAGSRRDRGRGTVPPDLSRRRRCDGPRPPRPARLSMIR